MSEWLTWQVCQFFLTCTMAGALVGTSAYHIKKSYSAPVPYKESMVRAGTYTGKGQFKCQTGC